MILRKFALPRQGPSKFLKHHTNSPITAELEPSVVDRVNIRRCYPYYKLLEIITEDNHDANIQSNG